MSFREKSAWACAFTTLIVYVPYFARVLQLFERQQLTALAILPAFIGAIVLQIVLLIIAHILFALRGKQEAKDERDLIIESKSFRNAYFVCAFFALFSGCWAIMYTIGAGTETAMRTLTPVAMAQMMLFCFVAAEATKYLTEAINYRRGG